MAAAQALAEPTGGQVVKGQAQINQTGASGATTTTIKQSTPQVSINWQSFNVGDKELVNFVQPDASSLAINRILGSQGSSIQGNINANGQVWLINPNGIVFGKNAQVNVGGLVATTLDTANPGSLTGTQRFSGNSTAAVTNSGLLNASEGGYVALLGYRVSNQGEINAPAGTVAMGAGSAVDLQFNNNQLLGVQVYESLLDAMSENGGVIRADAGQVLLKAGAQGSLLRSAVNNSGVIQARTVRKQGGKIVLVSGMKTGNTKIDGKLDASAPETGDGGFIETSGHTVQVEDTANISTKSAQGKTGEWLIDPDDFVVAASGGNITGANLASMLNSTSVIIETTNGPATLNYDNSGAAINGNGDIQINDRVAWSSNNMLTLKAYRNININAPISASGVNGNLQLYYGQGSTYGVINGVTASYKINAPVSLQSGYTFSTQLGSSGSTYNYWVITSLGSQGDSSSGSI
ncbi:MAG: filamentous hemagglutinin N-terminal domain-containing protein [Burkholderiales bacterium]|nr:filamentous hemagglutinin N-terminal domain-containing protein [Burkholderiales bacterium]